MSKKQTKCTPELTRKAAKYVKEGFTYSALATALGISEDTLYLWFRKAKQEQKEPYLSFFVEVKAAEAELLSECLTAVKASMKTGDARSAYFLLERRFGDSYGKKESLQVDQRTKSVNVNVNTEMTSEERRAVITGFLEKIQPKNTFMVEE
jgi:transposase-like protein